MDIGQAKDQSRDYLDDCITRVLNGTASPADVEAVALWAKHASKLIRTLAAREGK